MYVCVYVFLYKASCLASNLLLVRLLSSFMDLLKLPWMTLTQRMLLLELSSYLLSWPLAWWIIRNNKAGPNPQDVHASGCQADPIIDRCHPQWIVTWPTGNPMYPWKFLKVHPKAVPCRDRYFWFPPGRRKTQDWWINTPLVMFNKNFTISW